MLSLLRVALLGLLLSPSSASLPPVLLGSPPPSSPPPVLEDAPRGGAATAAVRSTGFELALAGAIATMIGDISMHPVDCVKTLQQSNEGAGLSMLGAGRRILEKQGVGGFYAGIGTYVTADGVAGAIKFTTYEALKRVIARNRPEDPKKAEAWDRWSLFAAAGASFIASSVVLVPGELIKQRLQMGQITSVPQGIAHILKTEGPLGLFAGYGGVCFRDVPYTMLEVRGVDRIEAVIKCGWGG